MVPPSAVLAVNSVSLNGNRGKSPPAPDRISSPTTGSGRDSARIPSNNSVNAHAGVKVGWSGWKWSQCPECRDRRQGVEAGSQMVIRVSVDIWSTKRSSLAATVNVIAAGLGSDVQMAVLWWKSAIGVSCWLRLPAWCRVTMISSEHAGLCLLRLPFWHSELPNPNVQQVPH